MMPVIKHFDPVMGVDIHIVVLPPGAPTPLPHPHIAMIIDPMDYVPILGAIYRSAAARIRRYCG
jgi:hypothetical protein